MQACAAPAGLVCTPRLASLRASDGDLVGLRGDGWVDLGECKWGTVRSAAGLERELDAKVVHHPAKTGTTVQRRFFVRSKPGRLEARNGDRWHDLEALYDVG